MDPTAAVTDGESYAKVHPRRTEQAARVLIVDDFEDARTLYVMFFERLGFIVDEANDGEEALARIAEHRPDAVVTDIAMPVMDGLELTRVIKGGRETANLPVIVLTGNAMAVDIRQARAAGADEVLVKPCVPVDLLELVKKHIAVPR
jgi:CheY-like chemotaxis protein